MKKIFISGKMTGLKPEVFERNFKDAEDYLMNDNVQIINPSNLKFESDTPSGQMLEVLNYLAECDAIYMLNNWKDSNGSQCEYWFSKMLNKEIMFQ